MPDPRLPRPAPGSVAPPRPVGVDPWEPSDYAGDSVEVLTQDEVVRRLLRPGSPLWQKLLENWMHFIQDVIEGWANEGRKFRSEAEKKSAIGDLVDGTIERIRKNPRKWIREHCDR